MRHQHGGPKGDVHVQPAGAGAVVRVAVEPPVAVQPIALERELPPRRAGTADGIPPGSGSARGRLRPMLGVAGTAGVVEPTTAAISLAGYPAAWCRTTARRCRRGSLANATPRSRARSSISYEASIRSGPPRRRSFN